MLTLQGLAAQVQKHINLGIVQFQKFLSHAQIYQHKSIIKVISDIISSNLFTHQHKQLAAVSLKFLLSKRLNQNYNLYLTQCWQQYFTYFISRQPGDEIEWRYLSLTINAVRYLLQELSQQVAIMSIQKFRMSNLVGKVMLMYAFKNNDEISQTNMYLFFTETIDEFLHQLCEFLKHTHCCCQFVNNSTRQQQPQRIHMNTMLFQHDVIMVIDEWLEFVVESPGEGWRIKLDQLAMKSEDIVWIIKEEMRFGIYQDSEGKWWYQVTDELVNFNYEMVKKIQNNNNSNSSKGKQQQKLLQNIIDIKSYALNILKHLTKTFSSMAGLEQFDTVQVLNMLELVTPILVEFIDKNRLIKQNYLKSKDNQLFITLNDLLTSIFGVLNTSATFIFLMQTFQQLKSPILYSIITPYLQAPQHELEQFTQDSQDFISTSENFIQKVPNDKCSTPKQACGNFMQSYFKLINSVQIQFMEFLASSLQYNIHKEKSPLLKQIQSQGYQIPTVQTIYAILTRIYFFADKSNQHFLNYVYDNFINQQFVFNFKKFEKVRFLIFIQYAYGQYFEKRIDQGSKFIKFAFETKDKSDVEFQIFLYFLQDTFSFGIAQNTWEYLISEIQTTKKRKFLSLIHRLLQNHIGDIPNEKILFLTQKIKNRIKKYVIENKATLKQLGTCYDFLYKCFQIILTLSQNKKLMSKEPSIMCEILEIVDFFNENQLQNYQFSCEVIKIFNSIIEFQDAIPIEFQKYLCMMSKIVEKNKFYGPLLETYYLILLKASETFQQKPQFLQAVKTSIEDKILSHINRTQQIIIESIFLLQNIYLVYPHLIKENRSLFDATFKIYQIEKENLNPNPKVVASILLFWMAGEYAFGNYNLGILNDCKIQIFTEQFGLMFSLNLRKLIEKYFQTQSLSYLLKLSLKLLDYEHFYKNRKNYKGPVFTLKIFKKYLLLDSFQEINSAIQFLRENLSKENFFESMQVLKNQIGEQMVNKLLRIRIFNNRTERNIITVKRN